jgi:hypothetical protein
MWMRAIFELGASLEREWDQDGRDWSLTEDDYCQALEQSPGDAAN